MTVRRPSREDAEAAVRTLLRWACDDPEREGLRDTPARVVEAYEEFFAGYSVDPVELLARAGDRLWGSPLDPVPSRPGPPLSFFRPPPPVSAPA